MNEIIFSIVHEKVRLPKLLIIVPFTLCLQMSILIKFTLFANVYIIKLPQ